MTNLIEEGQPLNKTQHNHLKRSLTCVIRCFTIARLSYQLRCSISSKGKILMIQLNRWKAIQTCLMWNHLERLLYWSQSSDSLFLIPDSRSDIKEKIETTRTGNHNARILMATPKQLFVFIWSELSVPTVYVHRYSFGMFLSLKELCMKRKEQLTSRTFQLSSRFFFPIFIQKK